MDKIRDTRIKETFVVDDAYLNGYARYCGVTATGVYLALCRHVNTEQKCWPGKKLIAEKLGISERSVYEGLLILKKYKVISVSRERGKSGLYQHNVYTLLDKSSWRKLPQENHGQNLPVVKSASGKKEHEPSAKNDKTHRQNLPTKVPQIEGNTPKEGESVLKTKKISEIIRGREILIGQDPLKLSARFAEHGYDRQKSLAVIYDSLGKQNPAGYVVKVLGYPEHGSPSDEALERAKKALYLDRDREDRTSSGSEDKFIPGVDHVRSLLTIFSPEHIRSGRHLEGLTMAERDRLISEAQNIKTKQVDRACSKLDL